MKRAINGLKRYLVWFRKHKAITTIIILVLIFIRVVTAGSYSPNATDNQADSSASSQQQPSKNTSSTASSVPTTGSQSSTNQTTPAKPQLRQDLAFQGDSAYCEGYYQATSAGTTKWWFYVKQPGELITHLSDNSGKLYRHDNNVQAGEYFYNAPVSINNVSEIAGLLYASDGNHSCSLSPQQ